LPRACLGKSYRFSKECDNDNNSKKKARPCLAAFNGHSPAPPPTPNDETRNSLYKVYNGAANTMTRGTWTGASSAKLTPEGVSFLSAFPMFVPSLSWQKDRLSRACLGKMPINTYKWLKKSRVSVFDSSDSNRRQIVLPRQAQDSNRDTCPLIRQSTCWLSHAWINVNMT
jgi:hypothetical protein